MSNTEVPASEMGFFSVLYDLINNNRNSHFMDPLFFLSQKCLTLAIKL